MVEKLIIKDIDKEMAEEGFRRVSGDKKVWPYDTSVYSIDEKKAMVSGIIGSDRRRNNQAGTKRTK